MYQQSDNRNKPAALILAGGYSSRMGAFKPLLPFGGGTVIGRLIDALRGGGAGEVVVVCGYEGEQLRAALPEGVSAVDNPDYAEGMYTSVMAGIRHIAGMDIPAFFVIPTDFPLLSPSTPQALLAAMEAESADIAYPLYQGVRGHPPLISAAVLPHIFAHDGKGGLKLALYSWPGKAIEVHLDDPGIVSDMDTREDYLRLLAMAGESLPCPTDAECAALMAKYDVPESVIGHCAAVAEFAGLLCERLNRRGCGLDAKLLRAAALLHDIARTQPNHAEAGAEILRSEGYAAIAHIVGMHHNIGEARVDEACLLFYADKRIQGSGMVSLEQRFSASLAKCKTPEARAAHRLQRESAEAIERLLLKEGVL